MFGWKAFDLNSISMEIQIAYGFVNKKKSRKKKERIDKGKGEAGKKRLKGENSVEIQTIL